MISTRLLVGWNVCLVTPLDIFMRVRTLLKVSILTGILIVGISVMAVIMTIIMLVMSWCCCRITLVSFNQLWRSYMQMIT